MLEDHGHRTGPEFVGQGIGRLRDVLAVALQPVGGGDMKNQRVVLGTALGRKNVTYRLAVQPVGPQAVHRLSGDAQQTSLAEDVRRLPDLLIIQTQGMHPSSPLSQNR